MPKIKLQDFNQNLLEIKNRISIICESCGRNESDIQILPVTKTHEVWAVEYVIDAGIYSVGENRVQEVKSKKPLINTNCRWELIGHLQTNKVKEAVELFDRIQSVDSLKLIGKLAEQALKKEKKLPIFLQCNTGKDPNKFGFMKDEMKSALELSLGKSNLVIEGLMTIAPFTDDVLITKSCFDELRILRDDLEAEFDIKLPNLSMGMTQDLEIAIEAGSTMIRVGTALFGNRS